MRRLVADLLAERLVGIWLFGSAALGDFSPQRSDIDIQAISSERLPASERTRLAAALSHDALPCPAKGLEFVLYARDDLGAPGGPAFQLNLNTGERLEHRVARDPDEDPRFWFVLDVSIGRRHGVALAGPPSSAAFPEPPRALVIAALREALDWYADAGLDAETLLSACRGWAWASDGRWRSKADAARWAGERLPDPSPVRRALALRERRGGPAPAASEVRSVVEAARTALDAASRTEPR